jgi:integrase
MASLKMHLAKAAINGLPIPDEKLTVWDDEIPGFGLLVLPSGTKTFYLHRRTRPGRQFKVKLGRFGVELTAEQARTEAKRICAQVALGQDPAAELRAARRRRKEQAEAPTTVAELWEACQEAHRTTWSANTARAYRSWFNTSVAPELGKLKAHEVQSSDVRRMHGKVLRRSPSTATQVLRLTSSMYAWAVASDDHPMIMVNPCTGALDRNNRGPGASRRERYPVGDELERLVAALVARDDLLGRYFLLLLLTGAREGELLNARWPDFDLDSATWTKPASTVKTKRLHRLPLNAEAVAVLREVKELSPFAPFAGLSEHKLRRAWAAICEAAGLEDMRIHDLRHWHASLAASSGESLMVIGGLLGHADQRTTGRYAHLIDGSVRAASAKVGQVISLAGRRS